MSKMKYIHFSEKGPRMKNEDCLSIVEIAGNRTLFVVCDGMKLKKKILRPSTLDAIKAMRR